MTMRRKKLSPPGSLPVLLIILIFWILNRQTLVHAKAQRFIRLHHPQPAHLQLQHMGPLRFQMAQQPIPQRAPIVPMYNRYPFNNNMANENTFIPNQYRTTEENDDDRFAIRVLEPPTSPLINGQHHQQRQPLHSKPQQFGFLVNVPRTAPSFPKQLNNMMRNQATPNYNMGPINIQPQQHSSNINLQMQHDIAQTNIHHLQQHRNQPNINLHMLQQQQNQPNLNLQLSQPQSQNNFPGHFGQRLQIPMQTQHQTARPIQNFDGQQSQRFISLPQNVNQQQIVLTNDQLIHKQHTNYGVKSSQFSHPQFHERVTTARPNMQFLPQSQLQRPEIQTSNGAPQLSQYQLQRPHIQISNVASQLSQHQLQRPHIQLPNIAAQLPQRPISQQIANAMSLNTQPHRALNGRGNQLLDLGVMNLPHIRQQLQQIQKPITEPVRSRPKPPPPPPPPPEKPQPKTFFGRLVHAVVPEIKKIISAFEEPSYTHTPNPHQIPVDEFYRSNIQPPQLYRPRPQPPNYLPPNAQQQSYINNTKIIVQIPTTVHRLQTMLNQARYKSQKSLIAYQGPSLQYAQKFPNPAMSPNPVITPNSYTNVHYQLGSPQFNGHTGILNGEASIESISTETTITTSVPTTTTTTVAPPTTTTEMTTTTTVSPLKSVNHTKFPTYSTRMPLETIKGVIPYAIAYFPPNSKTMMLKPLHDPNSEVETLPIPQSFQVNTANITTINSNNQPLIHDYTTVQANKMDLTNDVTTNFPPTTILTTTTPPTTTTTLPTTTTTLPTTTTTLPTTTTTLPTTTTTLPITTTTLPITTTTLPTTTTTLSTTTTTEATTTTTIPTVVPITTIIVTTEVPTSLTNSSFVKLNPAILQFTTRMPPEVVRGNIPYSLTYFPPNYKIEEQVKSNLNNEIESSTTTTITESTTVPSTTTTDAPTTTSEATTVPTTTIPTTTTTIPTTTTTIPTTTTTIPTTTTTIPTTTIPTTTTTIPTTTTTIPTTTTTIPTTTTTVPTTTSTETTTTTTIPTTTTTVPTTTTTVPTTTTTVPTTTTTVPTTTTTVPTTTTTVPTTTTTVPSTTTTEATTVPTTTVPITTTTIPTTTTTIPTTTTTIPTTTTTIPTTTTTEATTTTTEATTTTTEATTTTTEATTTTTEATTTTTEATTTTTEATTTITVPTTTTTVPTTTTTVSTTTTTIPSTTPTEAITSTTESTTIPSTTTTEATTTTTVPTTTTTVPTTTTTVPTTTNTVPLTTTTEPTMITTTVFKFTTRLPIEIIKNNIPFNKAYFPTNFKSTISPNNVINDELETVMKTTTAINKNAETVFNGANVEKDLGQNLKLQDTTATPMTATTHRSTFSSFAGDNYLINTTSLPEFTKPIALPLVNVPSTNNSREQTTAPSSNNNSVEQTTAPSSNNNSVEQTTASSSNKPTTLSAQQQFVSEMAIPDTLEMLTLLKTALSPDFERSVLATSTTEVYDEPQIYYSTTTPAPMKSIEPSKGKAPPSLSFAIPSNFKDQHPYQHIFRTLESIPNDRRDKLRKMFPSLYAMEETYHQSLKQGTESATQSAPQTTTTAQRDQIETKMTTAPTKWITPEITTASTVACCDSTSPTSYTVSHHDMKVEESQSTSTVSSFKESERKSLAKDVESVPTNSVSNDKSSIYKMVSRFSLPTIPPPSPPPRSNSRLPFSEVMRLLGLKDNNYPSVPSKYPQHWYDDGINKNETHPLGANAEEVAADLYSPALARGFDSSLSKSSGTGYAVQSLPEIDSVLVDSLSLTSRLRSNMHQLQRLKESFDELDIPEPSRTWAWRRILHMSVEGIIKTSDFIDRLRLLVTELHLAQQGERLARQALLLMNTSEASTRDQS